MRNEHFVLHSRAKLRWRSELLIFKSNEHQFFKYFLFRNLFIFETPCSFIKNTNAIQHFLLNYCFHSPYFSVLNTL